MAVSDFARARIGTVLSDKWRLEELLGRGGMATVYAGTHTRNRSRVAVKVLHPELGRESALRTRFLREGYVANSIKHPGIVRVFDDAADGDSVYLVMELLTGKTLKETWKKSDRAMPLKEIARVISSILDILAAAHEAGIVHRDIKPDNVFITDDGEVKLLDFGIAFIQELRSSGEHATTTGTTLGTPAFMPAEQALGRWALVDHRADIFSVGATARLLLTGRLAHEAAGATELLIAAATKRVAPVLSVAPSVPAGIAAVVDRAVAFEREDRYQSVVEMKADWDRAMAAAIASGTESVPPPPGTPAAQVVSWGSGAKLDSASEQPPLASAQLATGGRPSDAPTAIAGAVATVGASFTESAVAKDTRASQRISGLRIAHLGVVGLVAAVVIVLGVVAMGGRDRSAPASATPNPSMAEPVPVGTGTAVTEPTISPVSRGEAASSTTATAASSVAPVAAASAASRQAPASKSRPSPAAPPSSAPPSPKPQGSCPPVLYGRDMNDQPEYRCCGKPCAR